MWCSFLGHVVCALVCYCCSRLDSGFLKAVHRALCHSLVCLFAQSTLLPWPKPGGSWLRLDHGPPCRRRHVAVLRCVRPTQVGGLAWILSPCPVPTHSRCPQPCGRCTITLCSQRSPCLSSDCRMPVLAEYGVAARCACLNLQPAGAHSCPGPHRVRCHGESARGRPLGCRSGPVCPPGRSRGYHFLRKTYVAPAVQGSSHLDVCSLSLCHPDGDT